MLLNDCEVIKYNVCEMIGDAVCLKIKYVRPKSKTEIESDFLIKLHFSNKGKYFIKLFPILKYSTIHISSF